MVAVPGTPAGDARYQQLVELTPDGILVHEDGRIVMANVAAVRLTGATSRATLIGLPIERLLDPPYLKYALAHLAGDLSTEPAPAIRDTLHRLDGHDVEVEIREVAFVDAGRPCAHLVVRDITERLGAEATGRQLEQRLHQAQRLEAVGVLAGGVAHEVNNKMQVILGFGGFLLEDHDLSPAQSDDVREILAAANHAAVITRQLLDFSRRSIPRPEPVDLTLAVQRCEAVLRTLLGKGCPLSVVSRATPTVYVDPSQLQQVIINLAMNARDAMPHGGLFEITVDTEQVPDGCSAADGTLIPPGRYGTLAFADCGVGMTEATIAQIFQPFFTTKPAGTGTGLGLSSAYGVLVQNHGFIAVTSAVGVGSSFTVYFPTGA